MLLEQLHSYVPTQSESVSDEHQGQPLVNCSQDHQGRNLTNCINNNNNNK